MADELKKRLDALRAIAPRLNKASDGATRLVKQVEKVLVEELGIGVSADVCYDTQVEFADEDSGKDRELVKYWCIAFGRVAGRYQIHVIEEHIEGDASETHVMEEHQGDNASRSVVVFRKETPWPSCDRETKLNAIAKLPELLDKIHEKAEDLAAAAAAAEKIKEMIEGMGD